MVRLAVGLVLFALVSACLALHDKDIEVCVENMAFRQQEIEVVKTAFAKVEGVESYGAVKGVSQQGLHYAIAVEAGDASRLITYSSTSGFREIALRESLIQSTIAKLHTEVERSSRIKEEGVFGGQSCTFVRVFDNGVNVDGRFTNLSLDPSESGVASALRGLYDLIAEGTVISEEHVLILSPPELGDSEIDKYVSRIAKDLFFEISSVKSISDSATR